MDLLAFKAAVAIELGSATSVDGIEISGVTTTVAAVGSIKEWNRSGELPRF